MSLSRKEIGLCLLGILMGLRTISWLERLIWMAMLIAVITFRRVM